MRRAEPGGLSAKPIKVHTRAAHPNGWRSFFISTWKSKKSQNEKGSKAHGSSPE